MLDMPFNPRVLMENITRQFGTITALENVDFEVGYQEVVGLLGDNGAGKSARAYGVA